MGERLRIYVGGLGSSVQEDDLRKTFTSPVLGDVESVEIIRSKGRSFAYLDFLPASDKGLAKLFSTYNGCMWKGGRLKLEKAKEDYLLRLRREWAEDAELETKLSSNVDADESVQTLQKPSKDQDIAKMQLNIFFPKLRKIKPIPLRGTGKHKYSFQRVEVPPLPIHFCDCEEHSGPPESAKRNFTDDREAETYGVNEDELNMMKSILDKLLEKENGSNTVPNEAEFTGEANHNVTSADEFQVDDDDEDQGSDEDNLIINIVGQPRKRVALSGDRGQKTIAANQDSLAREAESLSSSIHKKHGSEKDKHLSDKKRKQSVLGSCSTDSIPSKSKAMKGAAHDSTGDQFALNIQPTDVESGTIPSGCDVASSHKTAWKDLVREKESTAFHISDILTGPSPEVEAKPRSDLRAASPCFNGKDGQEDQSSKDNELEKLSDVQSTQPCEIDDKSGRGASWRHKSSWLQLVADTNNREFNIAQILPGVTFEKQELQPFNGIDSSSSRNAKQQRSVRMDQNSPIEDISKSQGRANKDIHVTPRNVDALAKEQKLAGPDGEPPNSDTNQTVKGNDEASAPEHDTYLIPNNRAMGDTIISETCPFMRSAASMKEWAKSKAALSGSRKKKGKGKESVKD
ncbi:protein REPRESSOR OF SILENCING 3 [Sesamum alatum]|uniref:Protein REPRESSOR OF SILENCING 3 n=1 Tax=Sesamum alatum TaxID=300844 RepID=A0AAE2CSP9_9LAMI|nr:protein REPRESSOR OF SILENCING 3 [Sesamum alatum]